MRTPRLIAFLAAALASALSVVSVGPATRSEAFDYVTNGGFEDGASGWNTSGDVAFDVVDGSVVPPREGFRSARIMLGQTPPHVVLRQSVWSGTPAGTYRVSASVRVMSSSTLVEVQVSQSPASNGISLAASGDAGNWQDLSGDLTTVGVTNIAITVGVQGSPGDVVYIDDVRFDGANPATMTPTSTPSPPPTGTPTRTPTGTRTASPTGTPSATPEAVVISSTLTNGGFEDVGDDGAPTAWRNYGGALTSGGPPRTDARAARFESATGSTKWLYQTVLVDGGSSYEFSAWLLANDRGVAAAYLRISWYASADGTGAALNADDSTTRLTSPSADYRWLSTASVAAPIEARSARLRIMLAPVGGASTAILADDAAFGPADAASPPLEDTPVAAPPARGAAGSETYAGPEASLAMTSALRSPQRTAGDQVVINEVLYDPDGAGIDSNGEWVELFNPADVAVFLQGWSLEDGAGSTTLPAITLPPRGFIVIAASASLTDLAPGSVALGRRIGNGLGNDGDRLILRNASGAVVDAISWGSDESILKPAIPDVPAGHSIERRPTGVDSDSAADFSDNSHPSPGVAWGSSGVITGSKSTIRESPQTLSVRNRTFGWLPWALAASMSAALLVVMSWRAAPALAQRLRQPR